MQNRGAFAFFLVGTLLSGAIFLAMTWDTHRNIDVLTNTDQLNEQVVDGKRVWHDKECNLCHTIMGIGGYFAPDMTKVYDRIGEAGIVAAVQRPEVVFADSFRHMPNRDVSDEEVADLVVFLEWVSNVDTNEWPPQDRPDVRTRAKERMQAGGLTEGAAVFAQDCMGCHSLGGEGGSIGPALDDVNDKYDEETIARYVAEPTAVDPESGMPPQEQLTEQERRAVAEFLAGR